ncbi:hypothetical protein Zmor_022842 [Zophobas morio]|uniref:Uncharacterized protein n=1 Tax=Zophobas morio TaxID=2755281 RepID=A0AA38HY94_9CUCU|nr:hypothetical protein Zmor_022842 [Zophobas morio]
MTDQNYFDVIVKVYNAVGLKRSSPFPLKIISQYVLFPLLLALCGMVVINLKYKSQDVFGVVEVFESVASFGQMLIRKLILILYSSKIEKIITERSLFWSYDDLGGDFSSRLNMKKNQVFTRLKLFWLMCCTAVTLLIVTPIFTEEKSLPSSCWMPTDNKLFFTVVYILQSIFFIELILISPPTDGFFLFICTDLEIQLQVLSKTLQNVHIGSNQEKSFQKLKQFTTDFC